MENEKLTEKTFSFADLGDDKKDKIKNLIKNKENENFVIKNSGLFSILFGGLVSLVIPIIWYTVLYFSIQDERWYESSWWWVIGISIIINIFITVITRDVIRAMLLPIKEYTILTSLYLVQIVIGRIYVKPIWQISNIQATHNYRNGIYSGTDIKIEFKDKIENIWISSKTKAEDFMSTIQKNRIFILNKIKEKDFMYLIENDHFVDFQNTKEIKENTLFYKISLFVFLLSVGFLFFLYTVNSVQPSQQEIKIQQIENIELFNKPIVDLPKNGTQTNYYNGVGVAPLKVTTKEGVYHHFIKIINWETKKIIKTIFIRAGKSIETKLPIGVYEIKYASGKVWYGEKEFFGPEPMTIGSKADKKFNFIKTYEGYSGYTIELIMQENGNLHTSKIPMSEF